MLTVYIYIEGDHMEVFSTMPTFDLPTGARVYVANVNGGDSALITGAELLDDDYGARTDPDEIVARIDDIWGWLRQDTDRSVPDVVMDIGALNNLLLQLPKSLRGAEAARLDAEVPDHVAPHLAVSFSETVR